MNFISVAIMLLLFCEYLIALGTLVLCLFMNFIDMVHLFLLFLFLFFLFTTVYTCTMSLYELYWCGHYVSLVLEFLLLYSVPLWTSLMWRLGLSWFLIIFLHSVHLYFVSLRTLMWHLCFSCLVNLLVHSVHLYSISLCGVHVSPFLWIILNCIKWKHVCHVRNFYLNL